MRLALWPALLFILSSCGSEPRATSTQPTSGPSPSTQPTVGLFPEKVTFAAEGSWSEVVDGLRARFVRVNDDPAASAAVVLEIENTSSEAREIYWSGRTNLGYVAFRLFEGTTEVGEPGWRFGGNEPGASLRESVSAHQIMRRKVDLAFVDMQGKRALRIGAFWGREMPARDARLGGAVHGGTVDPKALVLDGDSVVDGKDRPQGKPWTGTLEVPPLPIE